MTQHVVKVYYKHPKTFHFGTFTHRYKIIAWVKALWATKFGWTFFTFFHFKKVFNMDFDTFRNEVLGWVHDCSLKPKKWRSGQAVFNYIDNVYGVARQVQFEDKIDCFYDDSKIDDFIIASYRRLCGGL
jgi:hypothetical protein